MTNVSPYPEIMTIEQAAAYLQLHPQVVYRHVRAGTLPVSRIGRTIRFKKSVLDQFLESSAWSSAGKYLDFVQKQKSQTPARPLASESRVDPSGIPSEKKSPR